MLPEARFLKKCAALMSDELKLIDISCEAGVFFLTRPQIAELNHDFRGKNKPTNVLSFPQLNDKELKSIKRLANNKDKLYLGDILLCAAVIKDEAKAHKMPLDHHVKHLIVHGALHLLGYDHMKKSEADKMERLEIRLLSKLAVPNPYIIKGE